MTAILLNLSDGGAVGQLSHEWFGHSPAVTIFQHELRKFVYVESITFGEKGFFYWSRRSRNLRWFFKLLMGSERISLFCIPLISSGALIAGSQVTNHLRRIFPLCLASATCKLLPSCVYVNWRLMLQDAVRASIHSRMLGVQKIVRELEVTIG